MIYARNGIFQFSGTNKVLNLSPACIVHNLNFLPIILPDKSCRYYCSARLPLEPAMSLGCSFVDVFDGLNIKLPIDKFTQSDLLSIFINNCVSEHEYIILKYCRL